MLLGKREQESRKKWWIIGIVSAILLLCVGIGLFLFFTHSPVKRDTYQLVKLSNDEVYFGKLSGLNKQYATLDNAYLQASNPSGDESESNDLTIVKISATVAKPDDTMYIARDKIVYWENLQKDSKIMNAIEAQ